jgi:hypothetical protein
MNASALRFDGPSRDRQPEAVPVLSVRPRSNGSKIVPSSTPIPRDGPAHRTVAEHLRQLEQAVRVRLGAAPIVSRA